MSGTKLFLVCFWSRGVTYFRSDVPVIVSGCWRGENQTPRRPTGSADEEIEDGMD